MEEERQCDAAAVGGKEEGTVGDEETFKGGQLDKGTVDTPCKYLSVCSDVQ